MNDSFLPPPHWFRTSIEIIQWAKRQKHKDDFISDCKLRPERLGQSYSYRIDVMEELLRSEIIKIEDDKLVLGTTLDIDWLVIALKKGNKLAWELANALDNENAINKKFNNEELKLIGDMGENFVIQTLKEFHPKELHKDINHVAKYDDTLGYDVEAPSIKDSEHSMFLEVKTSVRPANSKFQFYLSRNEFEIGNRNRNWCVVLVSIKDNQPYILGHLYCYQFESRLPRDIDENASWQSCKITIELDILRQGLP